MSTIYDKASSVASIMMERYGAPAKLIRVNSTPDKRSGRVASHEVVVECRAILAAKRSRDANGVTVLSTEATITAKPKSGDKLEVGGQTYTVDADQEIAPVGKAIIWKVVLK